MRLMEKQAIEVEKMDVDGENMTIIAHQISPAMSFSDRLDTSEPFKLAPQLMGRKELTARYSPVRQCVLVLCHFVNTGLAVEKNIAVPE